MKIARVRITSFTTGLDKVGCGVSGMFGSPPGVPCHTDRARAGRVTFTQAEGERSARAELAPTPTGRPAHVPGDPPDADGQHPHGRRF